MAEPVRLQFDASPDNLAVARQVAASMAARAHFDLDQVEDARLVMDEAVTVLMESGASRITCDFDIDGSTLRMTATGDTHAERRPTIFAWTIIHALSDEVQVDHHDDSTRIGLRMRARQHA